MLCRLPIPYMTMLVVFVAVAFAGCGDSADPTTPVSMRSPLGPVPESPQRPGDADKGYDALVNNAYVTCGIPYSAYRQTVEPGNNEAIVGRRGRNAELPYNLTAYTADDGVELVTSNCLGCHAARFNDELIIGLGNEFLDFTGDPVVAAESVGAYVQGEREAAHWRKWADRVAAIAPFMTTDTVGVNPANNLTLALFAHRDPKTLEWSEEPLLELPPNEPLPVSVPPWWRLSKKNALFYSTEGRGDHARFMMLISTVCTDTLEEAREIDAYFTDIRAYLASLEPPRYPFSIDAGQASTGQAVFEANCSRCHGTYDEQASYPNLVIGLDEVGTDPELVTAMERDADRFIDWFNESFYGEIARAAPALGYIAPPLDGVWATAPYLHNGSVPTLRALLDSQERPRFWRHTSPQSPRFDEEVLGWQFEDFEYGKQGAKNASERKRIYDTTLKGYANTGHTFGDLLDDEDRTALLEYLKSI